MSADLVLFSCLLNIYAHNVVGPRCEENTRMKHFIFSKEYPIEAYLFFYALMGYNSFETPANLESNMKWVVNIKTDDKLAITL